MGTGEVSKHAIDQVCEVMKMEDGWMTFQDIHAAVGEWALITIKHCVRNLIEEGAVLRGGSHQEPCFKFNTGG